MTSTLQKFKSFDKAFTKHQIEQERGRWRNREREKYVTAWIHGYSQPAQHHVQWAVYQADDHLRWQLFRVCLKGLTTQAKVTMLETKWLENRCAICDYGKLLMLPNEGQKAYLELNSFREWVRIMNYIGALRRGGQLDFANRIVS